MTLMSSAYRRDWVRGLWMAERTPAKAATKVVPRLLASAEIAQRNGDEESAVRSVQTANGIAYGLGRAKRCARCGRALSDPRSCTRGIGPECLRRFGGMAAWSHYTRSLVAAHSRGLRLREREEERGFSGDERCTRWGCEHVLALHIPACGVCPCEEFSEVER